MTATVTRILSEIDRLTPDERATVARAVLEMLDPPGAKSDAELEAVLARRAEEIRSGTAVGSPAAEVFARLKARRS